MYEQSFKYRSNAPTILFITIAACYITCDLLRHLENVVAMANHTAFHYH